MSVCVLRIAGKYVFEMLGGDLVYKVVVSAESSKPKAKFISSVVHGGVPLKQKPCVHRDVLMLGQKKGQCVHIGKI